MWKYIQRTVIIFWILILMCEQSYSQATSIREIKFAQQNKTILFSQSSNNLTLWIHLIRTQGQLIIQKSNISKSFSSRIIFNDSTINVSKIIAVQRQTMNCLMLLVYNNNSFQYRYAYNVMYKQLYQIRNVGNLTMDPQNDQIQLDPYCEYYRINNNIYNSLHAFIPLSTQISEGIYAISQDFTTAVNITSIFQLYLTFQYEFVPILEIDFQNFTSIKTKSLLQWGENYRHIIIVYGIRLQTINGRLKYQYKLQYYLSKSSSYSIILPLTIMTGVSFDKQPQFYFDETYAIIIVDQTLQNLSHNYKGKNINIVSELAQQITMVDKILGGQKKFFLSNTSMLVRDALKTGKNSIFEGLYKIINYELVILKQQFLAKQSISNWYSSNVNQNSFENYYVSNDNKTLYINTTDYPDLFNYYLLENQFYDDYFYKELQILNTIFQNQKSFIFSQSLLSTQYGLLVLYLNSNNNSKQFKICLYSNEYRNIVSQTYYYQSNQPSYWKGDNNVLLFYFRDSPQPFRLYHYDNLVYGIKQYKLRFKPWACYTVVLTAQMLYLDYNQFYILINDKYQLINTDEWKNNNTGPSNWYLNCQSDNQPSRIKMDSSMHFVAFEKQLYILNVNILKYQAQGQLIDQNSKKIQLNDEIRIFSNEQLNKGLVISRDPSTKLCKMFIFYKTNTKIDSFLLLQILSSKELKSIFGNGNVKNFLNSSTQNIDIVTVFNLILKQLLIFYIDWNRKSFYRLNTGNRNITLPSYQQPTIYNTRNYIFIKDKTIQYVYKFQYLPPTNTTNTTNSNSTLSYFKLISKSNVHQLNNGKMSIIVTEDQKLNLVIKYTIPYTIVYSYVKFLTKIFYSDYDYLNNNIMTNIPTLFIFKNIAFQHQRCPAGCSACISFRYCQGCLSGYFYNQTFHYCQRCFENCKTCKATNTYNCLECFTGFYLKNGLCFKCHPSCWECSFRTFNSCLMCEKNKYLQITESDKICLNCSQNCDKCANSFKCLDCSFGYGLSNEFACVKCPLDCINCNGSRIQNCISCKQGFYIQILQKNYKSCLKCQQNCKICIDSENCTDCFQNYALNQDGSCHQFCFFPCLSCNKTNPTKCASCTTDYKLNQTSGVCVPNIQCNIAADCKICPIEYILIYGVCYKCSANDFCLQCNKFDPNKCLECVAGYYLLQGECVACDQQCAQCFSSNVCKSCRSGYMPIDSNQEYLRCIKCSSNCKTCIFSITNCLSCNQLYTLSGSACVWARRVLFKLTLTINYAQLNTKLINGISNALAQILRKDFSSLKINSIMEGSTILSGLVQVKDLQDQTNVAKQAQTLTSGSTINGYSIESSQFVTSVDLTTSSAQNTQLITILSVVASLIAVGTIVIVGYLYYLKRQRIKKKLQDQQNQAKQLDSTFSQEARQKRRAKRLSTKKSSFLPSLQTKTTKQSSGCETNNRLPELAQM